MAAKDLGPLDWRTPIVDSAGRPSPEFQRRWNTQRNNNAQIGTVSVTFGAGPPVGTADEGDIYFNVSTSPFGQYVFHGASWDAAGGGGSPGGSPGQVQFNNAGAFGGFTVAGDGTLDTSTGALSVTKTGGVAFAASATTNTTNAANITSGTLPDARLANVIVAGGPTGDASHVAQITYDAHGRLTAAASVAIAIAAGAVSGLAASATSDTTNAANISSGTLPAGRMPALTGDVTTVAGAVAATLAASGVAAGSYGGAGKTCAITVDAKGRVTAAANVAAREVLTANRTYFVSTTGSDSNTGLSSGAAFLTIQKAINMLLSIDGGGFAGSISVADGTYSAGALLTAPFLGFSSVTLHGNTTTPANCIINTSATAAIKLFGTGVSLTIGGFKLTGSGLGSGGHLDVRAGAALTVDAAMEYAGTGGSFNHIYCSTVASITITANYTVSAGASTHLTMDVSGAIVAIAIAVTVTGTPVFSTAFVKCQNASALQCRNMTFTGAASAGTVQYVVQGNGVVFGNGGVTFPGGTAGTTSTGGQFV